MRLFEVEINNNDDALEMVAAINRDCKPYLDAIDHNPAHYPLYRGVGSESDLFIIKSVRLDGRRPSDSAQNVHDALNDYFIQKFEEPFRDAMFAAGTDIVAESFGNLYLVFPVGQFTFIWSPEVTDLVTEWSSSLDDIVDTEYGPRSDMNRFMNQFDYTNKNLQAAIQSNKEIMIRCEEYYGVRILKLEDPTQLVRTIAKELRKLK